MGGNFHTIFTRSLSDGETSKVWELGTGREYMNGEAMKERGRGKGWQNGERVPEQDQRDHRGGLWARYSMD